MEVKGKVHEVFSTQNVSDTFKKREIVLEIAENPSYPEFVKFEAIQDKTSLFDKCKVGDIVELAFNLKGRAWNDKQGKPNYFNTLQVWKLDNLGVANDFAPALVEYDNSSLPF